MRTRFYTTAKLSDRIAETPEGFLVCYDVPLARTGIQLYGPGETPVKPGPDGIVYIDRPADEVFRAETIASANGKPVTITHPETQGEEWAVRPDNFSEVGSGAIINPRRGQGVDDNLLFADVVLYTAQAIADVKNHVLREVSCGYDCDYVETSPGHGFQKNIIVNHLALVEKGRCGVACAIADHQPKEMNMAKKFLDAIRCAFKSKDESKLEEALALAPASVRAMTVDEEGGEERHIHVHVPGGGTGGAEDRRKYSDAALDAKFGEIEKKMDDGHKSVMDAIGELGKKMEGKSQDESEEEKKKRQEQEASDRAAKDAEEEETREIEGELEEEAPEGTGDAARKAKDSALLNESFQETLSLAEVIAPGIHMPTYDRAMKPRDTLKSICRLRASALQQGLADPATREIIVRVNGRNLTSDEIGKMPCQRARILFRGVAAAKQRDNNSNSRGNGTAANSNGARSLADINKAHRDYYAKQ